MLELNRTDDDNRHLTILNYVIDKQERYTQHYEQQQQQLQLKHSIKTITNYKNNCIHKNDNKQRPRRLTVLLFSIYRSHSCHCYYYSHYYYWLFHLRTKFIEKLQLLLNKQQNGIKNDSSNNRNSNMKKNFHISHLYYNENLTARAQLTTAAITTTTTIIITKMILLLLFVLSTSLLHLGNAYASAISHATYPATQPFDFNIADVDLDQFVDRNAPNTTTPNVTNFPFSYQIENVIATTIATVTATTTTTTIATALATTTTTMPTPSNNTSKLTWLRTNDLINFNQTATTTDLNILKDNYNAIAAIDDDIHTNNHLQSQQQQQQQYIDNNTMNHNDSILFNLSNNYYVNVNISTDDENDYNTSEYIFDRTDVRIIFITLYTLVFCCCFFGNLLVILVVTLSRRLRSITNFFLANLALADFCVGLFCVMQNLSIYLIDSWVFGEFLCRMYQFVHSLSYTASIFILVVICMERYFAIVHPITCKQILTAARLRMVILTVWITSAIYSTPKFIFSKTIKNVHTESGQEEEICVLDRKMFDSRLLDMINFILLYAIPLLVMTILYSKIAIALWRSSRGLTHHYVQSGNNMGMHNSMYHQQQQQHHHHHNHQHYHHNHHNHNHHSHQYSHEEHHEHLRHQQHYNSICSKQNHQNKSFQCDHHMQSQQQYQENSLNKECVDEGVRADGVNDNTCIAIDAITLSHSKSGESIGGNVSDTQVTLDSERAIVSTCLKGNCRQKYHQQQQVHTTASQKQQQQQIHQRQSNTISASNQRNLYNGQQRATTHMVHSSSNNVLRARRGVIRMLIIFVLTFALCNLPYHARKMWQYWSHSYRGDSNFNALLTPLTFLVTYFNSGINPLLYAFLSRNFRKGMRELILCSWHTNKNKSSSNSIMHHKRATIQTHSIPTETTHIGNEQL